MNKTSSPVRLYTKTGDKGQSNVIAGIRLPKSHPIFDALGTLDELNTNLGMFKAKLLSNQEKMFGDLAAAQLLQEVLRIQHLLLTCGALIAGSNKVNIRHEDTLALETRIDYYQSHTQTDWYTKFLLPGGTEYAARVDSARTVCRRAERCLTRLAESEDVELYVAKTENQNSTETLALVQAYINRLSDYLFALRCFLNSADDYREVEFGV